MLILSGLVNFLLSFNQTKESKRRLLYTYFHDDVNHTDLTITEQASVFLVIPQEITS